MIKSFIHKGLEKFYQTGSKSGIQPTHAIKLNLILANLNAAVDIRDMNFPGSGLHQLHGDKKDFWSVTVSGNWRLIFRFESGDAYNVNYLDYH